MNMNKKIKFGIIGCGWIVQKTYLPILSKNDAVDLYALFDLDYEKAKKCADDFNIEFCFNSFDLLLASDVDAVIIATPNWSHGLYAEKALKNNKHVICEKPTVLSVEEYKKLVMESKLRNLIFMPAYVNKFRSEIVELRQLINSGVVGNIKSIDACWIRKKGYPNYGSWFTNRKLSGGGVLLDLGSHVIEICMSLLPADISLKEAKLDTWYKNIEENNGKEQSALWYGENGENRYEVNVETIAKGKLIYQQNITINLHFSWSSPIDFDQTLFNIKGEKGIIKVETLFGFSSNRGKEPNRIIISINGEDKREIYYNNKISEQMSSFEKMCQFIIDCIRNDVVPNSMIEDGGKVIESIVYLYENEIPNY